MHAMGALTVINPKASLATIVDVLADASAPIEMRDWAANLLGNVDRPEAKTALLGNLPSAPERLQSAIAAALVRRREGADALLKAIAAGKASARLLQERSVTISLESSGLPGVADRIAALLKGLPPADQKLNALYARRRDGFARAKADPARGPRSSKSTAPSATNWAAKGPRSAPSSTASAAAASTA